MADYQASLRSLTIGAGTSWPWMSMPRGIIGSPVEAADLTPTGRDGIAGAGDRARRRVVQFECGIQASPRTAGNVSDLVSQLVTAWRPSREDVALTVDIPGAGWERTFYGRPRLDAGAVNLEQLHVGWSGVDLSFHCTAPYGYGPQVADEANTGTFVIPAAGLGSAGADTDRVTLVFEGNGSAPTLTSSTTGGRIALHAVPNGQEAVVRLWDGWVGVGAPGTPSWNPGLLDATSTWLSLAGGVENTLVLTGAAGVDVLYRPAYW